MLIMERLISLNYSLSTCTMALKKQKQKTEGLKATLSTSKVMNKHLIWANLLTGESD